MHVIVRAAAFAVLAQGLFAATKACAFDRQMLWVTNSAGNDLHVIDVATNKVVRRLEVGPLPHGIAVPDDASVVYVALEGDAGELLWVDPSSYEIRHRLNVGPRCNQIACTPDGRWVYVPCDDGQYWVVDGRQREVVARIQTGGRPHNTQASRDGRFMYLSPMGSPRRVTVVDVPAGHRIVGEIPFANVVRPPALSADGMRLFQNIDGLLGFQVADTQKREVFATVRHHIPAEFAATGSRCHGLAIRPDQKEIWSCNVDHQLVHVHDLTQEDFPEIAAIPMIGKIYWLCFTPDSRFAYISVRSENKVCAVDCATRKIAAHIDVGKVPKRNLVLTLPD
jgi:YVTN family beta-propeller protein